jgi:hypothetical protein
MMVIGLLDRTAVEVLESFVFNNEMDIPHLFLHLCIHSCVLHFVYFREEINSLRTEIPNPGERRTVKGSMLTTTGSEDQITDENIMVINSSEKTDDDSDGVNGEIGDDRLDSNEPMDSGNKTESAAGLFKKLLSINQGDKNAKPANVIEEDSPSNEEVNAITPTRILNGRQVRIPIRPTFLAFKNSVP